MDIFLESLVGPHLLGPIVASNAYVLNPWFYCLDLCSPLIRGLII